jgi:D-alanyl-D-alanine carboxypeptidase
VPQPGDGDLWPTTDDDKASANGVTHQLPIPDQQEQSEPTPPAVGGWFAPPSTEKPDEPARGRDEPHAKPTQQRTQPVSWPVAELERHVTSSGAEATAFVRPLPRTPPEDAGPEPKGQPAWPGAEETGRSGQDDPPNFIRPENARTATDDQRESAPAADDDASSTPSEQDIPAAGRTDDEQAVATETESDPEPAEPNRARSGQQESDRPVAQAGSDSPAAWPASDQAVTPDSSGPGRQENDQTASRANPDSPAPDQSATRSTPRPPESSADHPTVRPGSAASRGWFAQEVNDKEQPEERPDSPATPDRPDQGDQATRQVAKGWFNQEPGQRENDRPTRPPADSATVYLPKPTLPGPRAGDSETVNLTRPALLKPDRQPERPPERQNEWPPPEPPRAAPQRVGPPPETPPAPKKARKKRPLLIAAVAIVAVLGLAAGVVFGVPGLSDKLGLTGEDAVAIDPPPAPISYTPGLRGPDAGAPAPTPQGVESALAGPMSNPALGTITGTVIDPATGQTLYERDAGNAITPASTGKILTAAAALLSLDHTQQLVTKVVAGEQPGEVIIVGGGDPTISSLEPGEESIYPGAAHLSELVDQVKAGGTQVQTVYIDQSRYTGPGLASSWLPADVGAGYIAPIVPAMLDGDRQDPATNYSPRTTDPGRTLVDEFASRIGASPAGEIEKKAPANAKVLGEIRSAPLTQLVDNMLDRSENTLGDILAREVAIKAGEEPTFDGASKAMLDVLRNNNFDVSGVVLKDGSGMSEQNKMSANLLAQVLSVAAGPDGKDPRTAKLRPLLGGLPVAGGSGTLADRYDEGAATEGRGWVRAKTGTLTGVNSLAGIVLDKDNRPLVFAFLTTGTTSNTVRPALDTVSAALRGCGCT